MEKGHIATANDTRKVGNFVHILSKITNNAGILLYLAIKFYMGMVKNTDAKFLQYALSNSQNT